MVGRALVLQTRGSGFDPRLLHVIKKHLSGQKGKNCHFFKQCGLRATGVIKYRGQMISVCVKHESSVKEKQNSN